MGGRAALNRRPRDVLNMFDVTILTVIDVCLHVIDVSDINESEMVLNVLFLIRNQEMDSLFTAHQCNQHRIQVHLT